MLDHDGEVGGGPDGTAVQTAGDHLVEMLPAGVTGGAEDPGGDAQLERDDPVQGEYDDPVHGLILAYHGIQAIVTATESKRPQEQR